jgi:hypothetical protein
MEVVLTQPLWTKHRSYRGAASCRGPGAQHNLAATDVSVMLSGLAALRAESVSKKRYRIDKYEDCAVAAHATCSLGENNIGDAGAQHLAEVLVRNTTLQKLE